MYNEILYNTQNSGVKQCVVRWSQKMWTEVIGGGGPDCRVAIGHIHRGTPRQHGRGKNECEQKERYVR